MFFRNRTNEIFTSFKWMHTQYLREHISVKDCVQECNIHLSISLELSALICHFKILWRTFLDRHLCFPTLMLIPIGPLMTMQFFLTHNSSTSIFQIKHVSVICLMYYFVFGSLSNLVLMGLSNLI